MKPLGARRARILHAIGDHIDARGFSPSIREVAAAAGLSSAGTMSYQLRILRDAGLVANEPDAKRQLHLTDEVARSKNGVLARIALVTRCGACGQDMPANHIHPESEAAPDAPGAAPDHPKEITHG